MILNVEIRSIYFILTIVNFTLEVLITMHVNYIQLQLYGFEINPGEKCQLLCWSTILTFLKLAGVNGKTHRHCCSQKISMLLLMMSIECSQ